MTTGIQKIFSARCESGEVDCRQVLPKVYQEISRVNEDIRTNCHSPRILGHHDVNSQIAQNGTKFYGLVLVPATWS